MANFLALEQLLVTRLKSTLPEPAAAAGFKTVHVLTAADLAGVTVEQQLTPAVQIIYQGYKKVQGRSDGKVATIGQTWLVTVATRNLRDVKSGQAARNEAGLLASLVLDALMGWKPPSFSKPLELVDAPNGGHLAGFFYLPLAFAAEFVKSVP